MIERQLPAAAHLDQPQSVRQMAGLFLGEGDVLDQILDLGVGRLGQFLPGREAVLQALEDRP